MSRGRILKYKQFVAVAIAADRVRIASGEYSAGTASCWCMVNVEFIQNEKINAGKTYRAKE